MQARAVMSLRASPCRHGSSGLRLSNRAKKGDLSKANLNEESTFRLRLPLGLILPTSPLFFLLSTSTLRLPQRPPLPRHLSSPLPSLQRNRIEILRNCPSPGSFRPKYGLRKDCTLILLHAFPLYYERILAVVL